jgi:hypothetical protein
LPATFRYLRAIFGRNRISSTRLFIPIRPENIDAWLNPDPKDLAAQMAILDDRPVPYYEHRLAA